MFACGCWRNSNGKLTLPISVSGRAKHDAELQQYVLEKYLGPFLEAAFIERRQPKLV